MKDFSSQELELMLMQSNKNNPIEVVSLLLSGTAEKQGGVLTQIESEYQRGNSRQASSVVRNAGQTHSMKEEEGRHPIFSSKSRSSED